MRKLSFTTTLSFIFLALHAQSIIDIDLTEAQFGVMPASKIFEDIKYIPLETHMDGLLNTHWTTFYLTDKHIIACNSFTSAYLFDRSTGSFIRKVSSFGRGPNEYSGRIFNLYGFDEKNNFLFANDDGSVNSKYWKCINVATNKVDMIVNSPLSEDSKERFAPYAPWLIKDNVYVSFCNNQTGKNKVKLVIFDRDGNLIKKYPNYAEYDNSNSSSMSSMPAYNGIFYYYNAITYFKERNYNDTVFRVDENKITPHIVFKLGNRQPSYYHQRNGDYNRGKYLINFVYESDSYVLFNFNYFSETGRGPTGQPIGMKTTTHTGYYDKKSNQVYISSSPNFEQSGYIATDFSICFYPIAINQNNEMIAIIDPEELVKYKDNIDPKYKQLFQNIHEDDNPIVIIAKLKD